MPNRVWLDLHGRVLLDADGRVILCDNCPCPGTATDYPGPGTGTHIPGTGTLAPGFCLACPLSTLLTTYYATLMGGPLDGVSIRMDWNGTTWAGCILIVIGTGPGASLRNILAVLYCDPFAALMRLGVDIRLFCDTGPIYCTIYPDSAKVPDSCNPLTDTRTVPAYTCPFPPENTGGIGVTSIEVGP